MSLSGLNPKYDRILGVDASSKSFAYALFDKGKLKTYGEVVYDGNNTFDRLISAQDKVRHLRVKLKADLYIFESAVYIQNKKTVITLAYFLGTAMGAIVVPGAEVKEVIPLVWQKHIGNPPLTKPEKDKIKLEYFGKSKTFYDAKFREARKARTIQIVKDKFGVVTESDNIGDAIMIGSFGVDTYGRV